MSYSLRPNASGWHIAGRCMSAARLQQPSELLHLKKRYGNLGMTEVKGLRQLRDENARLKCLVADLTLNKHILSEIVRKKL